MKPTQSTRRELLKELATVAVPVAAGVALVASTAEADAVMLRAFPGFIYNGSTHDLALDLGPGGVVEVSHPEGCRVRLDGTGTVVDIRSPFLMDLVYDSVVEELNGWRSRAAPSMSEESNEALSRAYEAVAQGVVDRLRLALGIPE